jgi:predicted TIM-barrel fold metal-dependent hydrolase
MFGVPGLGPRTIVQMPETTKGDPMARRLDFPVFDVDNHLYETTEALTKFLPDQYKGVIDYVEYKGRTKILVRGQISNYIPNPTFSVVGSPGAQEDYFKSGAPEGASRKDIMKPMRAIPAFFEPAPRLELLDELGIDFCPIYPTLASLIEERFRDDPDLTHVVIHALNEWLHEHWTFNYEGRLFPVPIITLPVVDKAIAELEWIVERGAKMVLIRPAPVPGYRGPRSFALPEFDPFWDAVVDKGVLVMMHASDSGYQRYLNEWEGRQGEMEAFGDLGLFQAAAMGHRAVEDAAISFIAHGCMSRHPDLRVVFVENGSEWVRPVLHQLERVYDRTRGRWPEHPVDVFKRQMWIHPFHEEDPVGLIKALGADHVVFGSDYPHVEGMSDPLSYVDELDGLPEEDIRKVMGGNMIELLGLGATV